jgi:hypothetical protein
MGLNQRSDLAGEDLGAIFGIDLATTPDVLSGSRFEESKPARKRAGNAKSKVKPIRETAPPNSERIPTPAKKATVKKVTAKKVTAKKVTAKKVSRNSKPTSAVAGKNSTAARAAPTKKTKAPQKRIKKAVPNKKTATATTHKPKAKPAKQVAEARIVGATKMW